MDTPSSGFKSIGIAALVVALVLSGGGCGVVGNWTYESNVRVARVPFSVDVNVPTAMLLAVAPSYGENGARRLEEAIRKDIASNGPFTIDRESPQALLRVYFGVSDTTDTGVFLCGIYSSLLAPVPFFLLGVPCGSNRVHVNMSAQLIDVNGKILGEYSSEGQESCAMGYYYGSVNIDPALRQAAVEIRRQLAEDGNRVIAIWSGKQVPTK